jgi:hypothetical protein
MLFIFQKEENNSQLKLACRLSRQAAVKISIVVPFYLFHLFQVDSFRDRFASQMHVHFRLQKLGSLNLLRQYQCNVVQLIISQP